MRSIELILLFSSLLSISAADAEVGCFERGECHGGIILDHPLTETAEECAVACEKYSGCNYFTHYSLSDMCALFDSCPDFGQDCFDCISGRNDCSCFQVGKCNGHTIDLPYTVDEFACLESCRDHPDCTWITFTKTTKICALLEDCPSIDTSFTDDVSAPKTCSNTSDDDPLHIMVALGVSNADNYIEDIEIVNLGSGNSSCSKPPQYPFGVQYAAGDFVDGKARICGGNAEGVGFSSDCYEYSLGDDSWTLSDYSLSEETYYHESLVLSNGTWLILGGYYSGYTTEVYSDGVMTTGPDLPDNFEYAVGTVVNSTHIFLSGADTSDRAYLIDVGTWESTRMPDLAREKVHYACGMVESEAGERELVVAGGQEFGDFYDETEIFNFGTWEWREGPKLPQAMADVERVQMSKTFIIVGGHDGSDYLDTLYEFDNINYEWRLRDERLQMARGEHVVITLPNDWDVC